MTISQAVHFFAIQIYGRLRTLPRLSIGAEPKSASSIDQRRSPLRCVWILTSSHGSKPMAAVTRPKRMGCCDTPCFTTREKRVLASVKASAGRPRNRKEWFDHVEPEKHERDAGRFQE